MLCKFGHIFKIHFILYLFAGVVEDTCKKHPPMMKFIEQVNVETHFIVENLIKIHCVLDLLAGVEEDISQEPEVTDPKCGISIMIIPPNRIHLVGVPGLKSQILHCLPLPLGKKSKSLGTRVDSRA